MEHLKEVNADFSVSISELKKNPTAIINESEGAPIAVLNNNVPTAYLIPAETYRDLMEKFDDLKIEKEIIDEYEAGYSDYAQWLAQR